LVSSQTMYKINRFLISHNNDNNRRFDEKERKKEHLVIS
jgi:hypothetical protein